MPGMYWIPHVHDLLPFFDISVTFMTHKPAALRFLRGVTALTKGSTRILHEAGVCQRGFANLTHKTISMPAAVHCFDNTPDDVLAATTATGGVQLLEIVLAVLTPIKLVEQSLVKGAKALSAHETILVVQS